MASFSAVIQQSSADRQHLEKQGYMIQFATGVSSGRKKPTYNVVYQSSTLGPSTTIKWQTIYGLNWSAAMPSSGATVTNGGNWQQCTLGESYDLTEDGDWVVSQNNASAGSNALNIGASNYPVPINPILGTLDPSTGNWSPVWTDEKPLHKGGGGLFFPSESIKIWYQANEETPTMISEISTDPQEFLMTDITYYFSYDTAKGLWRTPQDTPFIFTPP